MDELDALWAFLVAALIAFAITPPVARLARRLGVIHQPRDRDLHQRPVPGLGGLAILAAAVVAALLFMPAGQQTRGIVGGAIAITLIGAIDDWKPGGLHPAVKLTGQFAAAAIPVFCDVRVTNVTLPFIDPIQLGDWSYPLTLVGIVAVMNVVNFTDGADGLAAGVCTIAAGTFAIIALSFPGREDAAILAALTAGASVGFLWHNFHPASIFMGDAGSNLLGLLLACVAIQGVLKTAAVVALFFPLLILAVPALDATFVVAKRIKYRRPVYAADSWHFHHRFANIGFSQRRTVLYLYGWTLSLAALALAMRFVPYSDDDGTLHPGWALVIGIFALAALASSVYLVLVLEILKFRRFREREIRRAVETGELPALSEDEIEREVEREVETGEFEAVQPGTPDSPAPTSSAGPPDGAAPPDSAAPAEGRGQDGPPEPVAGDGPTVHRRAQNRLR
jgi:UDP-GlcNAc:undecaprenyl-phosphate/decaprenyl-phosphate GlcNAc-1-phosphate transferase